MIRSTIGALVLLCVLGGAAGADATLSPDEDLARREYAAGAAAYQRAAYEEAIGHFRKAHAAVAAPELDYNIARCLDRLGRWKEAIDGYERFLAARPGADSVGEVGDRLALLRARTATSPAARRVRIAAATLAGGTIALAAAGSLLYGLTYRDYVEARDQRCQTGQCSPDSVAGLRADLRGREIGSGVLWGLMGVALVADVALWVVEARARR